MRKVFFASILAATILMGTSSCRKCQLCTKTSEPEVRVCEKDYDSNTAYGLAIDVYEFGGYDCR